jgi:hypothetical protein
MPLDWKTPVVVVCLTTFAAETVDLAFHGKMGHALPSVMHHITTTTVTTGTSTVTHVAYYGSAVSEEIYADVADSRMLHHDGETLPIRSLPNKLT